MEEVKKPPFEQLSSEHPKQWYEDWYKKSSTLDPWDFLESVIDKRRMYAIFDIIPKEKYTSILDLCCGNGFMTREIKKSFTVEHVVGADWLDFVLEDNKKKDKDIQYTLLDIKTAALPSKFDVVIFSGALNIFNENLLQVLQNVKSMTGKYLAVWDRFTEENRADLLFIKLLKEAGFREVKTVYYEGWSICKASTPSFVSLFEVK